MLHTRQLHDNERYISTVFRTFTADQRYRRKSRLSFTFFSTIVHKKEILDNREHFSTVKNNSRLSLTLNLIIIYISHILYTVLDYCLHFSIYFCPVWLAIVNRFLIKVPTYKFTIFSYFLCQHDSTIYRI